MAFGFRKHKITLNRSDIGNRCKLMAQEFMIGIHIPGCNPKDKIVGSSHLKAFHHLWKPQFQNQ
jgi:hypothetical protein